MSEEHDGWVYNTLGIDVTSSQEGSGNACEANRGDQGGATSVMVEPVCQPGSVAASCPPVDQGTETSVSGDAPAQDDGSPAADPNERPDFLPAGKLYQPGDEPSDPGPGLDPETGGPLDPPASADEPLVTSNPDIDPETGEPPVEPPHAEEPDADGGEYEPRDEASDAPHGTPDPDMDPETGEPRDPPRDGDPGDLEANTGRGAGPGQASADGQAPAERMLLGMPQREQAAENMAKLPPAEHDEVLALLSTAASHSPEESEYVVKALAAGHSVAELKAFQQQIAGKDKAWLDENLRLVGGSTGKGIKQQWSHSCAPTEVEAMKGELDPIYAWQLRQKNPKLDQADDKDGNRLNPALANEQFNLLTQTGGIVASRDEADHGRGGKMSTVLNSEGAGMGLTFDRKEIGSDVTMDDALATAQERLKSGLPVPICVGDDANPYAHAAMMTAVEDGPPRRFSIHDPWTGSVKTYSEADIRAGKLDLASCKKIAAIYPPSRK